MIKTLQILTIGYLFILAILFAVVAQQSFVFASSWTTTTALPSTIENASAQSVTTTSGTYVYNIGGYNGSSQANTIYYSKINNDGTANAWTLSSSHLPTAIEDATSTTYNNGSDTYLYNIGGFDGSNAINTVNYSIVNADGTIGSWTTSGNALPQGLKQATASVVTINSSNYLYVLGGINGTTKQSTIYYSPLNSDGSIGTWLTPTHQLTQAIAGASSITSSAGGNTYLYLIGGTSVSALETVFYSQIQSDGSPGAWTFDSGASLPSAINKGAAIIYYGSGYTDIVAFGGNDGSTNNQNVYYTNINIDGTLNSWTTSPSSLNIATSALSGAITNTGYIYEVGGNTGSVTSNVSFIDASLLALAPTPTPTATPSPTLTTTSTSTPTPTQQSQNQGNGNNGGQTTPTATETNQNGSNVPLVYVPNTTPTVSLVSVPNNTKGQSKSPLQSIVSNLGSILPSTPGSKWTFFTVFLGLICIAGGWALVKLKRKEKLFGYQREQFATYKLAVHRYTTKFQNRKLK